MEPLCKAPCTQHKRNSSPNVSTAQPTVAIHIHGLTTRLQCCCCFRCLLLLLPWHWMWRSRQRTRPRPRPRASPTRALSASHGRIASERQRWRRQRGLWWISANECANSPRKRNSNNNSNSSNDGRLRRPIILLLSVCLRLQTIFHQLSEICHCHCH